MGTTDEVGDRKWNDGQVINTLRKFSDVEKAYKPEFDLQLQRGLTDSPRSFFIMGKVKIRGFRF